MSMLYVYNIIGKNWCFLSRSIVRAIVIDFLHRSCSIVRVLLSNQFFSFFFFFSGIGHSSAKGCCRRSRRYRSPTAQTRSWRQPPRFTRKSPPPFFLFFIRNKIICVAHNRDAIWEITYTSPPFFIFFTNAQRGGGGRRKGIWIKKIFDK